MRQGVYETACSFLCSISTRHRRDRRQCGHHEGHLTHTRGSWAITWASVFNLLLALFGSFKLVSGGDGERFSLLPLCDPVGIVDECASPLEDIADGLSVLLISSHLLLLPYSAKQERWTDAAE